MRYDPDDIFYGDVDMEQAVLDAAGQEAARGYQRMRNLRAVGKLAAAARACPHGGGYPLASMAAVNVADPNSSEEGWRCSVCGSRLDKHPWDGGAVIVPCEWTA